jgi:hypothetical protein
LDNRRPLASRAPEITNPRLSGGYWECSAIIAAPWKEIVEQVGDVFDRLRLTK